MSDKPGKAMVLEPRTPRTMFLVAAALLVANLVAGAAIWRFDNAVDKTTAQSTEQRCRAGMLNNAIEVVLSQQTIITRGLADLSAEEEPTEKVVADFVADARASAPAADEAVKKLRSAVEECQTAP